MALVIRLVLIAVIATVGLSLVAYVFTRDRKYLNLAWNTFKYSVLFLMALAVMLIIERAILAV